MGKRSVLPLHEGWTFRQADDAQSSSLPVAQFPTNVHLDLLFHNLIPDPFVSKNENHVQWVGERAWSYRTTFESPKLPAESTAVLAFDGLDTFATVVLNGHEILETDNMFTPERVDVTKHLAGDGVNELVITFESAFLRGKEIQESHPEHRWLCWNGHPSRVAVRKAQYHWGWDWGPKLMTCGPWRPVSLEVFSARIADLHCTTDVEESLKSAEVVANADIEGPASAVKFAISQDDRVVAVETVLVDRGVATASFRTRDPKLWYPAGYGAQPLYTLAATLLSDDDEVDERVKRFGIRTARVVQRKLDEAGTTFFFEINNVPIFCGGSNWIPAHSFVPAVPASKYWDWVRLAVDGNQKMIRVWGGGIYEAQALYDACDELGVLVWQDFMFACGNYPAHPAFLASVRREAVANVKALRHHPSIVIWAGNNEDYQIQEVEGLTYDKGDMDPESWLRGSFPARYVYEKILVDVTRDMVPDTFYHFGSPWGGSDTRDPTSGDIHQWNVWHENQTPYQDYDMLSGRFVTEFGMQAFPDIRTIDSFVEDRAERHSQSSAMDHHNKAPFHERRLATYLAENIPYAVHPLETHVYHTQVVQAEALGSAYRAYRRAWKGPGRERCAGALAWQLNDVWPGVSWSVVDHHMRPKLGYYAVKRELAPLTVGMKRRGDKVEVWASNLTNAARTVDVRLRVWDVVSGARTHSSTVASAFYLPANQSTEISVVDIPLVSREDDAERRTVMAAYLLENDSMLARHVNWSEPLRYVPLQRPPGLEAPVLADGEGVALRAEVPVKSVDVTSGGGEVNWADNGVDLVPGETVVLRVRGEPKLRFFSSIRFLGLGS
ncbi:MAG: hypothetical protein M1832_001719 [Thelocarpon impressellum]|nr:MAG: hypothetical protein M1832_001719 [Thelocarpon impressellum]